ncbi:HAD family hydrolase [Acidianus sulfidivorans JP7]|uniref:HAD family hydrolase n=1 Tax=Acidianus sulfidivorans JP7 TaxID=619593 RepID=A0A2U9IJN4_9CREN|nr:HAD family hydrolase [Acidianus sulfidivorans]AWR96144.1 HAD family hydrolase [Acidianus sulfidivorans JP7]
MIPYVIDLDSIFDLSSMEVYRLLTSSLPKYYPPRDLLRTVIKDFDVSKFKPFPDSQYLEELSYRTRIYVVTNLPKIEAKSLLLRYNLDVFVQDVISPEDTNRFFPSKDSLLYISKKAHSLLGSITFITPHIDYAILISNLMRTILIRNTIELPKDIKVEIRKNLIELAEITAQHKVDPGMGDSAIRC